MTKKNIVVLTVSFLAVIGFYCYLYRDSFRKPHIQISHTIRPQSWALTHKTPDSPDGAPTKIVIFGMTQDFKLTSIKVVAVPELETNKYAHPVWELTSDSNSIPTRAFTYGARIRGMHPVVKGERPGELASNIPYRLIIEAGSMKGEHDFTVTEDDHLAH